MGSRRRIWVLGLATWLLAATGACGGGTPVPRGEGPSLVLFLVVDQARYDYLMRFQPLFHGGLARLLDQGAVFSQAYQDHAITETAPGHATLATGTEPRHSGIVSNAWFDRETQRESYSVGPPGRQSPANLRVTALGDWIKGADARAKVFAASGKDRAAVLLGGHDPDAAYWYDQRSGNFTSSSYYRGAQRDWLESFAGPKLLKPFFESAWEPYVDRTDWPNWGVAEPDRGVFSWGFPYALGSYSPAPGRRFYQDLYRSPFLDWYTVQFAKQLIEHEDLGLDGSVDLLALSFSALDTVGHGYGPDSPEVLDVLGRLDLLLQDLFDALEQRVGMEHVLVVLSADHGVAPLPEMRSGADEPGRRLSTADVMCVRQAGVEMSRQLGADDWLLSGFYLSDEAIARHGLDKAEVERQFAALLSGCDAIRRVWTGAELQQPWQGPPASAADSEEMVIERRFRNAYDPERSPDLLVQLQPHAVYFPGTGTTHGSVYDYDSHVPVIVMGTGVQPGERTDRITTADVAPTVARLIGVEPAAEVDGIDRSAALRASGTPR